MGMIPKQEGQAMKIKDPVRFRTGSAALGRFGLVVLLSGLMATLSTAQEARSMASRFSLAGAYGTPRLADESRPVILPSASDIRFRSDPAPAQTAKAAAAKTPKPPASGGKTAVQILAGVGVGVLGCAVVALTSSERTRDDDQAYVAAMTAGGLVAGALATPGLVHLIGSGGPQTASLGMTYAGGLAGAAVGAIILAVLDTGDGSDSAGGLALAGAVLLPAIGSVIGFNATRHFKSPPVVQTALLNVAQGKLTMGVPVPQTFISGYPRRSIGLAVRIFQAEL
jgi:hypothetical protein